MCDDYYGINYVSDNFNESDDGWDYESERREREQDYMDAFENDPSALWNID